MQPLLISIPTFCGAIGIGKTKTYEMLKNGTLQSVKLGSRRLILMHSVRDLIDSSSQTGEW